MTPAQFLAAPLASCDYEEDVTDLWQDATDPENVNGEIAVAMFDTRLAEGLTTRYEVCWVTRATLTGLRVTDAGGSYDYDRPSAIAVLGWDSVSRIEDQAEDRLNEDGQWD